MTVISADAEIASVMGSTKQPAVYSITINNKSGISQSYSLFTQVPTVKPPVDVITPHAILVARGIATGSGTAFLTIPSESYYAICGVNHQDEAVQMLVLDKRPMDLGSGTSDDRRRGTTAITKTHQQSLSFELWKGPADDKGEPGSFCIQTGPDFTYEQAKNNQFIVALGLSSSGSPRVGVYASFIPLPRTLYQIKPSKVFYVVPRALRVNEMQPDDVDFSQACQIDFSQHPHHVLLSHNDDTTLTVSDDKSSPPSPKI
ncbi:hypothetical protein MMC18_008982 [Xylographa bjoerkii]|nr:hypothetical protein [Xylographa bjoerkii]